MLEGKERNQTQTKHMKTGRMKTDVMHLAFDVCFRLSYSDSLFSVSGQKRASVFVAAVRVSNRVMETAI